MTLREFFEQHPKVAIAFSGGTDSSYLILAAKQYAESFKAYYVKSDFQPEFEYKDALRMAELVGADIKVLTLDPLSDERVAENPKDRCYYCKLNVFSAIAKAAADDGFSVLLDGTNASDDAGDRPGMKALAELSVLSPLRICGITKADVRRLSKEAGLFTWNKPSYACLATRIPAGQRITKAALKRTEDSESYLFSLGFSDFRIRTAGDAAKIQIREEQFPLLLGHRKEILERLSRKYSAVTLDLEARDEQ